MAVVVIDPGHYGKYNSGVCDNYHEGNAMLVLGEYLGEELTRRGAEIRFTRSTNDENPSVEERGLMAEGADLFISLHSDASEDLSLRGVTSYYSVRRPMSMPFAIDIGTAVSDVMNNGFLGAVARQSQVTPGTDYLGVLRAAVSTGVLYAFLIEHGFHTNMEDCLMLSDNKVLWMIAEAEANVIARYLNLSTPNPRCSILHIVQQGETLYTIGRRYGMPWQGIARINNIIHPYTIIPGQELIVSFPPEICLAEFD